MISRLRAFLYRLAAGLGDVQAAKKGRIVKRAGRRVAGRAAAKLLRRFFK